MEWKGNFFFPSPSCATPGEGWLSDIKATLFGFSTSFYGATQRQVKGHLNCFPSTHRHIHTGMKHRLVLGKRLGLCAVQVEEKCVLHDVQT